MVEHSMDEVEQLRADAAAGRLSRRSVLKRAAALGLSAPVVASLLAACGGAGGNNAATATRSTGATSPTTGTTAATTPTTMAATPTKAPANTPSGGASPTKAPSSPTTSAPTGATSTPGKGRGVAPLLRILYWQAPVILNPHYSQGNKDSAASSLVLEPLIDVDLAGNIIPVLAAEAPSIENGGVAADGLSVTYKLKKGVVWSDGTPFTADDVRFTWQFTSDQSATTTTYATYQVIADVQVVDPLTVKVVFKNPTPGWYNPFSTGYGGQILPMHIMKDFMGAKGRDAAFNLKPIGTGPYVVREFRPGDVITYDLNETYREADKPYFKQVEFKGGGDAASAARQALQTGETDWAWNLQVEKTILESMANGAAGVLLSNPGTGVERIVINFADPNTETNGARSEPSTPHPFLTDLKVRQAFELTTDRQTVATQLYGPTGTATANLLVAPKKFVSPNTSIVFDPARAATLLDEAGWVMDGGVRRKNGKDMSVVFTATINPVRQKTQEIAKAAWTSLGVNVTLKSVDPSVFFSSDPGNPDTYSHFYADFQMDTNGPSSPYPIDFLAIYKSDNPAVDLAQKSNNWAGTNANRWVSPEFNQLYQQVQTELDPNKQVQLFIAINDLLVKQVVDIGLVARASVVGASKKLKGYQPSPWTPDVRDIANWYFEG